MKKWFLGFCVGMLLVWGCGIAGAEAQSQAPEVNWTEGPGTVEVGVNLAKLNLPPNFLFANGSDAKKIMVYLGNEASDKEQGIVYPKGKDLNWFVLFEYDQSGYVKDEDGDKINANELLAAIREGTQEDNKQRKAKGIKPLTILGWDEKPHYDPKTHNLVWSILADDSGTRIVNYNVRILGRQGYSSVTLVADKAELKAIKPELTKIIGGFGYVQGKRYADYVPGKDRLSKLSLGALVAGGGMAAKMGLFAKLLLILKKAWILIVAAITGLLKWLGLRKQEKPEENSPIVEE